MDKFDRFHHFIFVLALTILFPFGHSSEVNVSAESAVQKQTSQGAIVGSIGLIQRLKRTELINGDLTHERLSLVAAQKPRRRTKEFVTLDPFKPPYTQSFEHLNELNYPIPPAEELYELNERRGKFVFRGQESVVRWFSTVETNTDVCALKFEHDSLKEYQLETFSSINEAQVADFSVTHKGHCGTCSSLSNLANYLENHDLTSAARSCGRKRNAKKIKTCLMNDVDLMNLAPKHGRTTSSIRPSIASQSASNTTAFGMFFATKRICLTPTNKGI